MIVRVSAPSNIALIKYMGKTDASSNLPANGSLSYTLENLRSVVEVELLPHGTADQWEPLALEGAAPFHMSERGREKFLGHFDRLKKEFSMRGHFLVRSANQFPSDAGIASSASSFAALTMATADMAEKVVSGFKKPSVEKLAELSRRGSGSSCRSFFSPWALWSAEGVRGVEITSLKLQHQLIVVDAGGKAVSSSEAHRRCTTSSLFETRPRRAEERLRELTRALKEQDWATAFEVTWTEFWDMHALFETSRPSFGYMKPGTLRVLEKVREMWSTRRDGPLATLDAGPNVHLLWREDQRALMRELQE